MPGIPGAPSFSMMKTIILGLGNPILGDDGVGWKVAEEVKRRLMVSPLRAERSAGEVEAEADIREDEEITVDCVSLGGISLMERLIGYERAILIDAFALDEPLGSILALKLSDLPNYSAFHTTSAHDTSLQNAIELGKAMGAQLPEDVFIIGIATRPIFDFSEDLSPPVAEAVPNAAQMVLDLLGERSSAQKN